MKQPTVPKPDSADTLNALVRDACSVVPMSKSAYRERLQAYSNARLQAFAEELSGSLPPNTNERPGMTGSDVIKELNINIRFVREVLDQTLAKFMEGEK